MTVLKSLSDEGVGVVCQVTDLCPISIRPLPTFSGSKVFPTIQQRPLTFPYLDETMPVYALLAYAKTAKTDMTPDERRIVSKLAAALKAARKRR